MHGREQYVLLAHFHPHITSLCCVEAEKIYVMLTIPFLFDSRQDMCGFLQQCLWAPCNTGVACFLHILLVGGQTVATRQVCTGRNALPAAPPGRMLLLGRLIGRRLLTGSLWGPQTAGCNVRTCTLAQSGRTRGMWVCYGGTVGQHAVLRCAIGWLGVDAAAKLSR